MAVSGPQHAYIEACKHQAQHVRGASAALKMPHSRGRHRRARVTGRTTKLKTASIAMLRGGDKGEAPWPKNSPVL